MAERTPETVDQAVHRLAKEARAKGVQVFVYPHTGEHYATSASNPGELHRVTLLSCDCPGFIRHQRCTHHSALLAEVGQLPPLPAAPVTAIDAAGDGPLVCMVGTIECLTCRRCGVLAWRGSCVFDHDPNAAFCYECAAVALPSGSRPVAA
jgi:hypothetical protein